MSLVEAFLSPNLKSEDTAYGLPGRAQTGLDCEDGGSLAKGGRWSPRRVLAWAATLVTVEEGLREWGGASNCRRFPWRLQTVNLLKY